MIKYRKIFFVIFLCSLSSLAYEIALARIFSISLWYHFAFMIISIAMLGVGASGTVLSLYAPLKEPSKIGIYSLLLGISISVSYLISNRIPFDPVRLSWDRMQLFYVGFYYLVLSVPFFFSGLIVATAFSSISSKSGMVYGADLLGAGIGSMGVLYLMLVSAPEKTVFIVSSVALAAAFIAGGKGLRTLSFILILATLSLLAFRPAFIGLRMSPYKGLQVALKYPGSEHLRTYFSPFSRIDTFKSAAVHFAPGLSLRYLDALPEQIGFSIDGGEINAITQSDGRTSPAFLKFLPSALPYEIGNPRSPLFSKEGMGGFSGKTGKKNDVLIINPRGGLQCLVAKYYGSLNIYKIESNPLLVTMIKRDYGEFSGDIYSSNTWSGLGRSWLNYSHKKFDIIDIPMLGTAPSGSFGISEDYNLTVEAYKEYLDHLKPNGILSVSLYILPPPRMDLRILNTAIGAMEELGVKGEDIEKHVAAIRSWGSICILTKKSKFTSDDIEAIKKFSKDRWFDLIYYPGIKEEETNIFVRMPSNEYYEAFEKILNPETRRQFLRDYIFDVKPVHDETPFFYYYLKLKNIKTIYKIMGEKWQYFIEEGYILPAVFVQVLFLGIILMILPVTSRLKAKVKVKVKKKDNLNLSLGLNLLPYFAFLGIGFMFVEASLVQKMIFPLENPSYAFATVLTSILMSSGIGSLVSHRVSSLRSSAAAIAISLVIVVYSIFLPAMSDNISQHSMQVKILLVFLTLLPLGFLMGVPFPIGIRILGEENGLLIPWAWAINGCFSVLSPILAVMLAIAIGFKIVLWLGALTYLMAFITLRLFLKKTT